MFLQELTTAEQDKRMKRFFRFILKLFAFGTIQLNDSYKQILGETSRNCYAQTAEAHIVHTGK